MGLGVGVGGCLLVLSRDRPPGDCGGVVSPAPRGWRGQPCGGPGRLRPGGGELERRREGKESGEAWERGARRTRARTAGAA